MTLLAGKDSLTNIEQGAEAFVSRLFCRRFIAVVAVLMNQTFLPKQ